MDVIVAGVLRGHVTDSDAEKKVVLNADGNKVTFYLVGTKSDLRDSSATPITPRELRFWEADLGLQGVCETSAKEWHDNNVEEAFNKAWTAGLHFGYPETMR